MSLQNSEMEGIKNLRSGSLFLIISVLLVSIGFIIAITGGLLGFLFSLGTLSAVGAASSIVGTIIVIAVLVLLSAIIGLVGILRIRSGFSILKSVGRDVGVGRTGTTIYLVGLIIAIIGALLSIILIGFSIVVLAGFLILIGGILIGAGFYKVGEIYNEGLVRIGGIFIAIPFSLFNFIGFIWAYIGLGSILAYIGLGKVKPLATATQQSFGPQVYQVGQGTIKNNGYAYITLYSSTPASIVSARIEGVNIMPISISPNVLQIGNNEVTMFFGNLQSLIPNRPYTITFTINIGGNIINISTTAIYQP